MNFDYSETGCLLRIAAACVCGLCLGLERKIRQHAVGMRTLILISVSSALLCMLSVSVAAQSGAGGDPSRMAAGVITGIGFLGGGAILRQGFNIRGLTSAAVIWTAAALGLACGAGRLFLAGAVLAVSILSLVLLEKVEWRLFPAEKTKALTLIYKSDEIDIDGIRALLAESGLVLRDLNMTESLEKKRVVLKFSVKAPGSLDFLSLSRNLQKTGSLVKFAISDN